MPAERHHPRYHFTTDNWMNDPIPIFWNGEYHVFLQHNPNEANWGNMHWAHAVSRDLAHWQKRPIALAPTPGSPDQDGCWTGCVVAADGQFYAFYTGIPQLEPLRQVQCLATSRDLISWEKFAGNPVIAEQPEGFGACFRDPQVWKEADSWYMVIGSELPERKGGAALLYRSADLIHWQYLHVLATGTIETGHEFECPDFFPLGDRHVLLASSGKTHWRVGDYAEHRFTPETQGVTDGGAFYAAKTLLDGQGRRILFGWITEQRPVEEFKAAGWSGVLSLPRVLRLQPDGTLGMEPAPELSALRGVRHHFDNLALSADAGEATLPLDGIQGDALEILVRFAPTEAATYGVLVRCSPDLEDSTEIGLDRAANRLGDSPLTWRADEPITLHLFVDRSVVEAFANGRACMTYRTYPQRQDSLGVRLFVRGGTLTATSLDVWELAAS